MYSRIDQQEEILQSQSNRKIVSEVFKRNYIMDQRDKEHKHRSGAYPNPHIHQHMEDLFDVETYLKDVTNIAWHICPQLANEVCSTTSMDPAGGKQVTVEGLVPLYRKIAHLHWQEQALLG